MKQETFIDSVQELFPGCGREAAQGWIDFAAENVEQEQYVNFIPEPNQAAAVEKWLDTLYAGLYQAKQEFGTEVASEVYNLPLSQNHCLYPWEMKEAAAYLQSGGDLDNVSQLSVDGEFDSGAPFFPTLEDTHHQEHRDTFRYYITNDALNVGTFPHMEGMTVKESVKPVDYENGKVKAYGFIDYPRPLTLEQEREYSLIPSTQNPPVVWGAAWKPVSDEQRKSRLQRHENYLKAAEMGMEQNYNQLDGIINNEQPRVNQGYTIIASETVGCEEVVLAHSPTAPDPFVTWERNIQNDEQTGREDFYWGKYFSTEERARENFHTRVEDKREMLSERRPSILSQLKSDAPRKDLPAAPQPGHKKDAPER